jgi:peptidyl-prolyl cis-trans isomerase SurA
MRQELVKDIAVTPGDVRKYFESVPADSVPFVPTEVEVEIITHQPRYHRKKSIE